MITFSSTDTPMGQFSWLRDEQGIRASGWTADPEELLTVAELQAAIKTTLDTATEAAVRAFFDGDPSALDEVVVVQHGGAFIEAGWQALHRIRPGHTLSYTGLAHEAGRPAAVRAAASACATNRCALFVPCHRVVRNDGTLGGFRWGIEVKRALLDFEAAQWGD